MGISSVTTVPAAPARSPGAAAGHRSFGATLRAHASAAPPPSPSTNPARVALEALERARRSLDGALAAARNGQTFTAQELLALQSQAYRYSQVVDVASKVVE